MAWRILEKQRTLALDLYDNDGRPASAVALRRSGPTFPKIAFVPERTGIEQVEIDASNANEIQSTVHLTYVASREGGRVLAAKVMECHCPQFSEVLSRLLEGPISIVATIARRGWWFNCLLPKLPDVRIVEMTNGNRRTLLKQIAAWVKLHSVQANTP